MRIGIFGGSFDPIHTGHAMLANQLSQSGEFDEVWLVPGRINPYKVNGGRPAPIEDRLRMAGIAAEDCASVRVCDIEKEMPEPSYTINTLRALHRRYPEHDFRLIIGSDNWEGFGGWREAESIIREFGVVIYARPDYVLREELPDNVIMIGGMPQVLVSSTYIRNSLTQGKNLNYLVPKGVIEYIKERGLYGRD